MEIEGEVNKGRKDPDEKSLPKDFPREGSVLVKRDLRELCSGTKKEPMRTKSEKARASCKSSTKNNRCDGGALRGGVVWYGQSKGALEKTSTRGSVGIGKGTQGVVFIGPAKGKPHGNTWTKDV